MSNTHQIAADGTPEEPLPTTIPDDAEQPSRPRPGPPDVHIERLRARIETLIAERDLWRARARENSLAVARQKSRIAELERNPR